MEVVVRICVVRICAYTNDAYTGGVYIEEIYSNPNASFVFVCFHICAFKEVVVRKCIFIGAFICVVCICTYMKDVIMEVANFCICAFTEGKNAHLRKTKMRIYGSSLPYMYILPSVYAYLRKPKCAYMEALFCI